MSLVYDDAGGSYDFGLTSSDAREAAKLDQFVPSAAGDTRPWWERVAEYGLTRAIDNQVGPAAPNKTSTPATFAGQNGKTYSQVGPQPGSGILGTSSNTTMLLIAAAAVAGAFFIFRAR